VVDTFQKKYPYIKVDVIRVGSSEVMPRLLTEYRAGKYFVDVMEYPRPTQSVFQREGITQPFFSSNLAYIQEGAITKAPAGGALAAAFRESGIGLAYNTKLTNSKLVPKTYQDLLNPKLKGQGAVTGSDTGQRWMGTMLVNFGEEFMKKVAKQDFSVHMVSAAALLDMIINGEYMFSPTIFDSHVTKAKEKGAPCDWVPLEPVYVLLGQISLPKNSPNPHAAMLFIDFQLSKESAEIHRTVGYNSPRKDAVAATTYKKFYGENSAEDVIEWDRLFDELFIHK
jgi:ABC-type Fe3+ transport system substrate-binding protein